MHRISLRGPWNLAALNGRIEASRKFHAPRGFSDEPVDCTSMGHLRLPGSIFFRWHSAQAWPLECLRLNETIALREEPSGGNQSSGDFFYWEPEEGVGQLELTSILRPFNEIVLVWSRWPASWQVLAGRYTPDSQHPFHFDSWLEIQS